MERYDPYTDSFIPIDKDNVNYKYITTDRVVGVTRANNTADLDKYKYVMDTVIEHNEATNIAHYNDGYFKGRKDAYKDIKDKIRSKIFEKLGKNKGNNNYSSAKDTAYTECIDIIDEYLDSVNEPIVDIDE